MSQEKANYKTQFPGVHHEEEEAAEKKKPDLRLENARTSCLRATDWTAWSGLVPLNGVANDTVI